VWSLLPHITILSKLKLLTPKLADKKKMQSNSSDKLCYRGKWGTERG
jgi:hypothetical protein